MRKPWTTTRRASRAKVALALLAVVSALGGVAYALEGSPSQPAKSEDPSATAAGKPPGWLALTMSPLSRVVPPGGVATFVLRIYRGQGVNRLRRRVRLKLVDEPPDGASASFNPRAPRSSKSKLTIRTAPHTPPGRYHLELGARAGGNRFGQAAVTVIVSASGAASGAASQTEREFTISGDLAEDLLPGLSLPLDLEITNPETSPLDILGLGVEIAAVTAPNADSGHPCTEDDFSVDQFSGAYGFTVPASSTRSLSALGFPEANMPHVAMLDRPVNQDGCKGASLQFAFTGTGAGQ